MITSSDGKLVPNKNKTTFSLKDFADKKNKLSFSSFAPSLWSFLMSIAGKGLSYFYNCNVV
jgi:hypothetical protein